MAKLVSVPKHNNTVSGKSSASKKATAVFSAAKTVLSILYEVGEITFKSFFPHPYYHTFCSHGSGQDFHYAVHTLKKRGLVTKKSDTFRLTKNGEKEAFFAYMDAQKLMYRPKKPKWDGLWRMIVFDVPEKKRRYRDYLRQILKTLGFKELQRSVWVTPYKIPKFLEELLWEERIKHHTRFITVKEIDYDSDLKNVFGV